MNTSETSPQANEILFTKWLRNLWLKMTLQIILVSFEEAWEKKERDNLAEAAHHRYLPLLWTTLTEQEPAGSSSLHQVHC